MLLAGPIRARSVAATLSRRAQLPAHDPGAVAGSLPVLLAARVVLGIALGGFWSISAALAMRLVPSHLLRRAMSIILTGVTCRYRLLGSNRRLCRRHLGMANRLHDRCSRRRRYTGSATHNHSEAASDWSGQLPQSAGCGQESDDQSRDFGRPAGRFRALRRLHLYPRLP